MNYDLDDLPPVCYSPNRWDHVAHNIYQGGHYHDPDQSGVPHAVKVGREFDLVVSMHHETYWRAGPPRGVEQVLFEVRDGTLNAVEWRRIKELGRQVADASRAGKKVLSRCEAGWNRSGLVIALALLDLGMPLARAIEAIRAARGPHALTNPHFLVRLAIEARIRTRRARKPRKPSGAPLEPDPA